MIPLQPLNENVLVKVLEEEKSGEVLLPESHVSRKFGAGSVIASEEECPVRPGDTVYFDKDLLTTVEIRGEELKFIKFSDILGYEQGNESNDRS